MQKKQNDSNIEEFNELMQEVADLGEREATVVSYFAQGVIAQARASKTDTDTQKKVEAV